MIDIIRKGIFMQKAKTMKRTMACFLIAFLFFATLPIVSFADNSILAFPDVCSPNYVVTPITGSAYSHSNVNLRYYPSSSAKAYTPLLAYRTPLNVTGRSIGDDNYVWYQVIPTSGPLAGQTGYVRFDCLDFVESGASIGPVES